MRPMLFFVVINCVCLQIMGKSYWQLFLLLLLVSDDTIGKIHHLTLEDDIRSDIQLTNFGYVMQGSIQVTLSNFSLVLDACNDPTTPNDFKGKIGFTFSQGDEVLELLRAESRCLLDQHWRNAHRNLNIVYLIFDLDSHTITVEREGNLDNLDICRQFKSGTSFCRSPVDNFTPHTPNPTNPENDHESDENEERRKREVKSFGLTVSKGEGLASHCLNETTQYATSFAAHFWKQQEEGEFYLIFHNCYNLNKRVANRIGVDFTIDIIEKNEKSYLEAGEVVKPTLYFIIATIFFSTGIAWVHLLKGNKSGQVFKIHYLMTVLVFLKSLSLLCHGINYYCISIYGHQQEVWAVLYYFMHLVKGALLFGVIILIGTGWTFFKNFLTEKDRKLFMIIVPLQILDNLALIIIEESEQATQNYKFWMQIFILVDLVCCSAIILPIIWSIRHLQEASSTDGKAAFNLNKLKLFRHFYIMVICYIYLTRIVKYLVVFTVPFRYTWLVVVVEELGTWVFFVMTGYQFKPNENNPYLKLAQSDDEDSETEALTQSGVLEGVTRIKRGGTELSSVEVASARNKANLLDEAGPDIDSN